MHTPAALENLEERVMMRIGAWRTDRGGSDRQLPASALMVAIALIAGVLLGWNQASRSAVQLPASESILVSADTGLPSMLLADNQ